MPFLRPALKRIACLAAAWVVACNAITGVNDLKVVDGCTTAEDCQPGCEGAGAPRCDANSTCFCDSIGNGGSSGNGGSGGSGGNGEGGSGNVSGGGAGGSGAGGSGVGGSGAGGSESVACTPGEARDCSLASGGAGIQVCNADAASYGLCTVLQATPLSVGFRCTQNSQCALGLTCSTSTMVNGPQRGYCTRACADDATCQRVDPRSHCYLDFCLAACTTDVGEVAPPDLTTKCQGRPELACFPVSGTPSPMSQEGICLPVCQSDADCGGRFCNLFTGGCEDTAPVGAPVGAACILPSDCAGGVCQPFGPTAFFCTGACSQLEVGGCGFPAVVPLGARQAACVDITPTSRYRDINLCLELCDTAADCAQLGWLCSRNGTFASQWGRIGFCTPPDVLCSNRCLINGGDGPEEYAADNECDDGGLGSSNNECELGTDCADCGVRIPTP